MACQEFIISIYDTTLPSIGGPEPVNFSEKGDVKLIYEGGDTKVINLFNSRLTFSLEVPLEHSTEDLYYEDLFTGDEFKFKVVVTNENGAIIWSGFMLPDAYQEPYTTGTFYPKFIATDGIAKLKGKKIQAPIPSLNYKWYLARHSIISIIADCLKLTALELEIKVDAAIENKGVGKRLDKMFLNARVWYKEETQTGESCFDILTDVITELGCVLFQQNNTWYIIGINNRSSDTTVFNNYNYQGIYTGDSVTNINHGRYLDWNASPQVRLNPPFKEVSVTTGISNDLALFNEDIVAQKWLKTEEPQDPPVVKYWKGYSPPGNTNQLTARLANKKWEVNNDWRVYTDTPFELTGYLAADVLVHNPQPSFVLSNYIELKVPPYISGSAVDISFDYVTRWPIPANHDWVNTVNNDVITFSIFLNSTEIISNRPGFVGREAFFLENTETPLFKNGFTDSEITSSLELENFALPFSGFLNVKFYHPGDAEGAGLVNIMEYYAIHNFNITEYKEFKNPFVRRRRIDFSKIQNITIKHGDSTLDATINSILVQELIPEVEFTEVHTISVGVVNGVFVVRFTDGQANFDLVNNNKDRLYWQRYTSDFQEYLIETEVFQENGLNFIRIAFAEDFEPLPFGRLLVRTATGGNPQDATWYGYREQWQKTTNSNGYMRYGFVLAELIHDVYERPSITIEGTTRWLMYPLEMLKYEFNNSVKKFTPIRLTLNPGANETKVTAIEYINDNVQDYE